MAGFTGIRWDARPAEQLSRDLARGAGAKPLFEAGMSWAAIASALHELDTELAQVRKLMSEGWRGKGDTEMVRATDTLATWIADTADMAARNAAAAERQAVAHTVAMAAMPDAEVISALGQLEDAMRAVAAPPHSLIAGGLAKLDDQAHGMKAQAARVMDSYELATTPVATAWHAVPAPEHLVHRATMTGENAKAAAKLAQQSALGQGAMMAQIAAMTATPLGAYRSDEYVTQTRRDQARFDVATSSQAEVVVHGPAATASTDTVVSDGHTTQSQMVPGAPVTSAATASGSNGHGALPVTTNYSSVQESNGGSQVASPSVIGVPEGEGA